MFDADTPNGWCTQQVRLIAFPAANPFSFDGDEWWKRLFDSEPDSVTRKPTEREWSGARNGLSVGLTIDPLRVGWSFTAMIDPLTVTPSTLPSIGSPTEVVPFLCEQMSKWFEIAPPLKRLTFASRLMNFVETKDEAYRLLNTQLKTVQVDLNSSDLIYRINRICKAKDFPTIEINRLCTWSAARLEFSVVATLGGAAEQKTQDFVRFASVLDQDINTTPESQIEGLDGESLAHLFRNLCDEGLRIAEYGDDPEAPL